MTINKQIMIVFVLFLFCLTEAVPWKCDSAECTFRKYGYGAIPSNVREPQKPHPMENSFFTTLGQAQQHRFVNPSSNPPSFPNFDAARRNFDTWNHDNNKRMGF
jgi:hypothetical protein